MRQHLQCTYILTMANSCDLQSTFILLKTLNASDIPFSHIHFLLKSRRSYTAKLYEKISISDFIILITETPSF